MDTVDAAGRVHHVVAVRLDQRLVLAGTIPLAVMNLPVLNYSGVWSNSLLYLIPTQGALLLFGEAFDQVSLTPWQAVYAVVYPAVCVAASCWAAKATFGRYVIARSGGL